MKIPLIKPYIDENIKNKVIEVLNSGYLTEGPVTKEFENIFKKFIDSKYAIAVTSCTTGLEIALRTMGIGEGDEVIVPDYTYPATAAVVNIVGATAVIVDVDKNSMLIDYDEIEKAVTPKTRAIIPVSIFGSPLNYTALNEIKKKHNLFIIEDSACSIGAEYENSKVGTLADISVFSLHPRKFITTGEGGMITTDNDEWANWMNSYKHFGMGKSNDRESISFDIIGTNYKLSNVLSAIGLEQMKIIDTLLSRRITLAQNYDRLLQNNKSVKTPAKSGNVKHSYQSYCVFVKQKDKVLNEMRARDIEVQIGSYSLHTHPAFNNNKLVHLTGNFNNSKHVFEHCLALPLYHDLTFDNQEYIVENITEILG
jgi:dTDP-4-amino-4,6-dideoxygalactose transaminase